MGSFARKLGKKKPVASLFDMARKKANSLDKETSYYVEGMRGELNHALTFTTMIHLQFILYHEWGFGARRFKRLNDRIQLYNDCLCDKLVDYPDMEEIMIKSDEMEQYGPTPKHKRAIGLGWKDYKPHDTVEDLTIAKTGVVKIGELKQLMILNKKRKVVEMYYQALEVLIITALQDEFDWGKGRISKLIDILRRARKTWDIVRFEYVLNVLMNRGVVYQNARDKAEFMNARMAMEGLM